MSVKIRLQRRGRKKRPLYHIIIADSRSPRDGRFIETIGSYNPLTKPATIELDREKAFDWLMKGAEPTDTVRAILRYKGIMYRKHLSRGVAKGALTQEEADAKYQAWVEEKEAKIARHKQATSDEIAAFHLQRSGTVQPVKSRTQESETSAEETARQEAGETVEETTSATAAETTQDTAVEATSEPTEESAPVTTAETTQDTAAEATSEAKEESAPVAESEAKEEAAAEPSAEASEEPAAAETESTPSEEPEGTGQDAEAEDSSRDQ